MMDFTVVCFHRVVGSRSHRKSSTFLGCLFILFSKSEMAMCQLKLTVISLVQWRHFTEVPRGPI